MNIGSQGGDIITYETTYVNIQVASYKHADSLTRFDLLCKIL